MEGERALDTADDGTGCKNNKQKQKQRQQQ
jgi:hypothetical protein